MQAMGRSLMKILNRIGPKCDPYGTPEVILNKLDLQPSPTTKKIRFIVYELSQ